MTPSETLIAELLFLGASAFLLTWTLGRPHRSRRYQTFRVVVCSIAIGLAASPLLLQLVEAF